MGNTENSTVSKTEELINQLLTNQQFIAEEFGSMYDFPHKPEDQYIKRIIIPNSRQSLIKLIKNYSRIKHQNIICIQLERETFIKINHDGSLKNTSILICRIRNLSQMTSLKRYIGDLTLEDILKIYCQLADCMHYLKSQNIIFDRLCTDSVLLDSNENVFLNFLHSANNYDSISAYYMSPEVLCEGKVVCESNWWSLGIILLQLAIEHQIDLVAEDKYLAKLKNFPQNLLKSIKLQFFAIFPLISGLLQKQPSSRILYQVNQEFLQNQTSRSVLVPKSTVKNGSTINLSPSKIFVKNSMSYISKRSIPEQDNGSKNIKFCFTKIIAEKNLPLVTENMEDINLSGNLNLTKNTLLRICEFSLLNILDLSSTNIQDLHLPIIASVIEIIKVFKVAFTTISDAGLMLICNHVKLCEELDLSFTSISNEGLRHLLKVKNLKRLGILGCCSSEDLPTHYKSLYRLNIIRNEQLLLKNKLVLTSDGLQAICQLNLVQIAVNGGSHCNSIIQRWHNLSEGMVLIGEISQSKQDLLNRSQTLRSIYIKTKKKLELNFASKILQKIQINEGQFTFNQASAISTIKFNDEITSNLLQRLEKLPNLTALNMASCNLTRYSVKRIMEFKYLVHLDLSRNNLQSQILRNISKLSQLETLELGYNSIGFEALEYISYLTKLTFLGLASNKVDDRNIDKIIYMPNLMYIDLRYNNISKYWHQIILNKWVNYRPQVTNQIEFDSIVVQE